MKNPGKVDLRVRRTHKLLFETLITLIKEKGIESLSVTEVCERAMVHRTTFYKYYEDKYHLLYEGCREIIDDFLSGTNFSDTFYSFFLDGATPPPLAEFFRHVAENREIYQLMLGIQNTNFFYDLARRFMVERLHNLSHDRSLEIPVPLIANFCAGGMLHAMAWWLKNDMPYTAEEMAKYVFSLISKGGYLALGLEQT